MSVRITCASASVLSYNYIGLWNNERVVYVRYRIVYSLPELRGVYAIWEPNLLAWKNWNFEAPRIYLAYIVLLSLNLRARLWSNFYCRTQKGIFLTSPYLFLFSGLWGIGIETAYRSENLGIYLLWVYMLNVYNIQNAARIIACITIETKLLMLVPKPAFCALLRFPIHGLIHAARRLQTTADAWNDDILCNEIESVFFLMHLNCRHHSTSTGRACDVT